MDNNRITILGSGESGIGAAILAKAKGYQVWLSDYGTISPKFKEEIEEHSFAYEEGGHTMDKVLKSGLIVKSPGISDTAPAIVAALEEGIEVISEIEFASRYTTKPIIAITGSNGKTTTTLLIHHLLISAGIKAVLAGNIGSSLARHVVEDDAELYVVEVSSFQLDGTKTFAPATSVLLNITPDHLDRYNYDFDSYAKSKMSITRNMQSGLIVYNLQDPELAKRTKELPPQNTVTEFSISKNTPSRVINDVLHIEYDGRALEIPVVDLPLKGEHNQMNIMAAVIVAMAYKVSNKDIIAALPDFSNHPNRLEYITTINGVDFINDSKATNVEAVYYALGSFDRPIIWIAGGQDKGNDYSQIEEIVKAKVKAMICLGLDNKKLIEHFTSSVDKIVETRTTDEAAQLALSMAEASDVVLLSPACASFDLFDNYAQRGEFFRNSVLQLKEKVS